MWSFSSYLPGQKVRFVMSPQKADVVYEVVDIGRYTVTVREPGKPAYEMWPPPPGFGRTTGG
jgi:hypothetical protein